MPTRYQWHKVISNGYSTKVIRGTTKAEVEQKAASQLATWQRQDAQRRARWQAQVTRQAAQDQLRAMEAQAQAETEDAQTRLQALNNTLRNGLHSGPHFDWAAARDHRPFGAFVFNEVPPDYGLIAQRFAVPAPSALDGLFAGRRKKREELETRARDQFERERIQFEARKAAAYQDYERRREQWIAGQNEYNAFLDKTRLGFSQGDANAVNWVLGRILKGV